MRHRVSAREGLVRAAVAGFCFVALVAAATVCPSPDGPTRRTADVAMVGYGLGAAAMLLLADPDWSAATPRGRWARDLWTLGCLAFLVHMAVAYRDVHHWSHSAAYAHVEEVSGFGPGAYVSDLFAVTWASDVLAWWLAPSAYARRPAWLGRTLHSFMAFMVFNATVVYEAGPVRWFGVIVTVTLGALWTVKRRRDSMAA